MTYHLWTRLRKKAGEIFRIVAKLAQRPFPWEATRISNDFSSFWFSPSTDCPPVMLCGVSGHLVLHWSWNCKISFLILDHMNQFCTHFYTIFIPKFEMLRQIYLIHEKCTNVVKHFWPVWFTAIHVDWCFGDCHSRTNSRKEQNCIPVRKWPSILKKIFIKKASKCFNLKRISIKTVSQIIVSHQPLSQSESMI